MGAVQMKVAKPSERDFDATYQFLRILENLTRSGWCSSNSVNDWTDWDKDDEDYILLNSFKNELLDDEFHLLDEDDVDNRFVLWEYIKYFFNKYPSALGRIIMCADMAMENAFDKNSSTIEWNPKLNKALEMIENIDSSDSSSDNASDSLSDNASDSSSDTENIN